MHKEQHLKNQASAPSYAPNAPAAHDIKQIIHMLPHRYPFQMVDKIIHLDARSVTGIKNVTINEPFFSRAFSRKPYYAGGTSGRGTGLNRRCFSTQYSARS